MTTNIPIPSNNAIIDPATDVKPSLIMPSIIAYNKCNAIPVNPAKPPINKTEPMEINKALNADANALKKIPKTKKIIANVADQKITNATKPSPPYSMFAEFILSAALFISASDIWFDNWNVVSSFE